MSRPVTRKLTTILAADAAGFSRAMDADEVGTYAKLNASKEIFGKLITRHGGRIANTAGDGLIADFSSPVEATQCAIEVQSELTSNDKGLQFRIGVHLGDVIVDGDDLIGEGVNLAARLQSMAEPGGVLISQQVYDQVHAKLTIGFEYLGEKRPKNLANDVPVYRIAMTKSAPDFRKKLESAMSSHKHQPIPMSGTPGDTAMTSKQYGLIGAVFGVALIGVNLVTGGPIWTHWVILTLATLWGLKNSHRLVPDSVNAIVPAKTVVLTIALVFINAFSWSGYAWALWPVCAILVLVVIRRILT